MTPAKIRVGTGGVDGCDTASTTVTLTCVERDTVLLEAVTLIV